MKNNIIKYIFIIIVIILISVAVYIINKDKKEQQNQSSIQQESEQIQSDALRLAIVGYDTMNPLTSTNKNVQEISKIIFEPLFKYDKDYKIEPYLATEMSKTGDKIYLIKLRNDVKWNGTNNKLKANDVKFTIEKLKEISSIYSNNVSNIESVEIIDDYTVKLNVLEETSLLKYHLTFPIVSEEYYVNEDFINTEKNSAPQSTGMYYIESNDSTAITLKLNESWWGLKESNPKIEKINITMYSSMGEVYNAFKLGNVDLINTQSMDIENNVGTLGFNKKEYKGREYDFLTINCSNEILSFTEVRKAILYAIDRNSIIANIYSGKYYNANFPLDYGSWLYTEEAASASYNPEQAKQILIDAGWEFKNNNWQKYIDGKTKKIKFNLLVNSDNQYRNAVAELIRQNLEAVGIQAQIISVDMNTYLSSLDNRTYDIAIAGTNVSLIPDLKTYFGEVNLANYYNEEVQNIINSIKQTNNENELQEKYKQLIKRYNEDIPYISLYINKATVLYSSKLNGNMTPNAYNIFYDIENWYRQY